MNQHQTIINDKLVLAIYSPYLRLQSGSSFMAKHVGCKQQCWSC
jgi:hypothetical protein